MTYTHKRNIRRPTSAMDNPKYKLQDKCGNNFALHKKKSTKQLVKFLKTLPTNEHRLAWLIFIILIMPSVNSAPVGNNDENACYDCGKHNREWSSSWCKNDIEDCGDCFEGYHPANKDEQECVAVDQLTVESGQDAVLPKGINIIMQCHSSKEMTDCKWSHRDLPLTSNDRHKYSYVHYDRAQHRDCSLEITNFGEEDVGHWKCHIYRGGHDPDEVKSSWLTLRESKTLIIKNSAVVPLGQPTVLLCNFERKMNCEWYRRGYPMDIAFDYSYLDTGQNGRNTIDCSVRIHHFEKTDAGQWLCRGKDIISGIKISKPSLELQSAIPALQMTEKPQDQTVTVGNSAELQCKFNKKVECFWERNGIPLTIDEHYKYMDNQNGRHTMDCSLRIATLTGLDLGNWKCCHQAHNMSSGLVSNMASLMVEPQVVLNTGAVKSGISSAGTIYTCKAVNGYPPAQIQWEHNHRVLESNSDSNTQQFLTTASSTISGKFTAMDILECVIAHPTFPETKRLQADTRGLSSTVLSPSLFEHHSLPPTTHGSTVQSITKQTDENAIVLRAALGTLIPLAIGLIALGYFICKKKPFRQMCHLQPGAEKKCLESNGPETGGNTPEASLPEGGVSETSENAGEESQMLPCNRNTDN